MEPPGSVAPAQRHGVRPGCRAAALIVYFDTSALIKLLLRERGSELAEEMWGSASECVASWLLYAEARAALAAAARDGRIKPRELRGLVKDLAGACAGMKLVGVDERLARTAGDLAERYALRGYDAMHLATALAITGNPVVATWDGDLARAAMASGRAVAPVPADT